MATAAAPARLVAGGEDGRRGPPPGTAALGPGRARRRQALVVETSLRWGRRRRRGRRRRHSPSPSGAARRTRRARTQDVRFVKGGVARAGCRRRGRAGGNRSGAADLAAVLVTYHRRGVAGRWRRVEEKIALEDDRLDAVIAKLLFMAGVAAPAAGTDCRRRRPPGSSGPRRTAGGDRQVVAITGPKRSGRTRTC